MGPLGLSGQTQGSSGRQTSRVRSSGSRSSRSSSLACCFASCLGFAGASRRRLPGALVQLCLSLACQSFCCTRLEQLFVRLLPLSFAFAFAGQAARPPGQQGRRQLRRADQLLASQPASQPSFVCQYSFYLFIRPVPCLSPCFAPDHHRHWTTQTRTVLACPGPSALIRHQTRPCVVVTRVFVVVD